jgi:hypothetical protein
MLSFSWSSRMTMKMRNSQVQRGVIVQQMEQRWSCYNQSPSGRLLGVEPDYLLYSKVPPHWTPVQNGGGNAARKIFAAGGVQGGRLRPLGAPPWRGVSGAAPPKLKTAVKLPCKSIVISSQSGPFIRRMI